VGNLPSPTFISKAGALETGLLVCLFFSEPDQPLCYLSARRRAIGHCCYGDKTQDVVYIVFISPDLLDVVLALSSVAIYG
jgi:hypothetical protein